MKAVGARLPRYDGIEHVTGRTQFVDDVRVPGMLWAKALRSPVHSAEIKGLDVSKAEAMPGVHAVIHGGAVIEGRGIVRHRPQILVRRIKTHERPIRRHIGIAVLADPAGAGQQV